MSTKESFTALCNRAINEQDASIAAACHPYVHYRQRDKLEAILFATVRLKRKLARTAYTPASVLHRLFIDADDALLRSIARHSRTQPVTLAAMASRGAAESLLTLVASHKNTPDATLADILAQHCRSPAIRRALCYNSKISLAVQRQLAVEATVDELKGIVRNPAADQNLLRLCRAQPDDYLQAEVIAHPDCPADLLLSAERSNAPLLRRKLAGNPSIPESVLLHLLDDTEAQVRAAAVNQLNESQMASLDPHPPECSSRVRRNLARRIGLTPAWITHLAGDTDSWVRRLIARSPATPDHVLCKLAQDYVSQVRRGVARNPLCSSALQQQLANDPDSWVRAGVALRQDLSAALIETLFTDKHIDVLSALAKGSATPRKMLQHISRHADADVRRAVILNTAAPAAVLHALIDDPYPLNRVLLAGHCNLNAGDLQYMLHDPRAMVRFASAAALARQAHDKSCNRSTTV